MKGTSLVGFECSNTSLQCLDSFLLALHYVDLYWPQQNLAVEIDGRIKYEDLGVLYREKVRQEDLQAAGLIVVRWLAEDVAAFPEHVVERLQSLL